MIKPGSIIRVEYTDEWYIVKVVSIDLDHKPIKYIGYVLDNYKKEFINFERVAIFYKYNKVIKLYKYEASKQVKDWLNNG